MGGSRSRVRQDGALKQRAQAGYLTPASACQPLRLAESLPTITFFDLFDHLFLLPVLVCRRYTSAVVSKWYQKAPQGGGMLSSS